jgi:hypothetical protein
MNANQVLQAAKQLGIKGIFIKKFKNCQELRAYSVPHNGVVQIFKIRATAAEHA